MSSKNHVVNRLVWLVFGVVLVACTERNPERCADGFCIDPERPFCDVGGEIGGTAGQCIAVTCTPNEFERCRGNQALTCDDNGDNFVAVNCENGCDAEVGCLPCPPDSTECRRHIIPKYLPTICDEPATQSFTVSMNTSLDTGNPLTCSDVVAQPMGPEICVLHYRAIRIERNQVLTAFGPRALALIADEGVTVDGEIDVSATGINNGPGGGLIKSGATNNGAGGGAGYRHAGGAGGTASADGAAANGGEAGDSPAAVTELFGGRSPTQPTVGQIDKAGGGGGAITLVSCTSTVAVPGLIDAGGGGGLGGGRNLGGYIPAGGGGSGGTVVLQGMMVDVAGQIFANGGGGGSGGSDNQGGGAGADGPRSIARAIGGVGPDAAGNGGSGGNNSPPLGGKKAVTPGALTGAGAGGGSAGFILYYTPTLVFRTGTPMAVSPDFEDKGTVATN